MKKGKSIKEQKNFKKRIFSCFNTPINKKVLISIIVIAIVFIIVVAISSSSLNISKQ